MCGEMCSFSGGEFLRIFGGQFFGGGGGDWLGGRLREEGWSIVKNKDFYGLANC